MNHSKETIETALPGHVTPLGNEKNIIQPYSIFVMVSRHSRSAHAQPECVDVMA